MEDEALGFPMLLVKPSPGLAAFPPWSNKLRQNQPEIPMSLAFLLPSWPLPGVPEAILNTRHLPSHFCHCIVPGDGIGSFLAHHCHFHTSSKAHKNNQIQLETQQVILAVLPYLMQVLKYSWTSLPNSCHNIRPFSSKLNIFVYCNIYINNPSHMLASWFLELSSFNNFFLPYSALTTTDPESLLS